MSIADFTRTIAFRLTLLYSLFFAACVILLLGFIYWQTAAQMTSRVDVALNVEAGRFGRIAPAQLAQEIDRSVQLDQRHVFYYGLFAQDGKWLAGNVSHPPQEMRGDTSIRDYLLQVPGLQAQPLAARALERDVGAGRMLLIGHDVQQLTEFREVMRSTFFWGGSLTILLGLVFGLALSFRPMRRVEQIQQVCERIIRGEIGQRLPVSGHRDELDLLAGIVNRMLDEIERLMSEAKSVGDNIAHDLRTPLTRLRAVLHRLQQQMDDHSAQRTMADQMIADVDALLLRFRALLRISEIENKQRRAGFKSIRLQDVLEQAVNFLMPLAEDKSIRLTLQLEQVGQIQGDGELMFEVFINLIDNAIKFTPSGGRIEVRLLQASAGAQVDIIDSGSGIDAGERKAVLNRFYRGQNELQVPGSGLGLSLVMAILRLHHFGLELKDARPGTCATINCWVQRP